MSDERAAISQAAEQYIETIWRDSLADKTSVLQSVVLAHLLARWLTRFPKSARDEHWQAHEAYVRALVRVIENGAPSIPDPLRSARMRKTQQAKRRATDTHFESVVLDDLSEWLAPHEYERELPKFASRNAILRDINQRKYNGLEDAGVIRKVGRRFLIHKSKYTAFRLGVLPVVDE